LSESRVYVHLAAPVSSPTRGSVNSTRLVPFQCWLTVFPDQWQKDIPADSLTMMLTVSVPHIHVSRRLTTNYRDYEVVLCIERVVGERLGTKHL
jgi:hypothetical protein